jgi:hypothetical protein
MARAKSSISSIGVAWQEIPTVSSASVLRSLSAGCHLTTGPQLATHWLWLTLTRLAASVYNLSMERTENIVSDSSSIVACWFVAAEMCFPSRCLIMDDCICYIIEAFSPHVTIMCSYGCGIVNSAVVCVFPFPNSLCINVPVFLIYLYSTIMM